MSEYNAIYKAIDSLIPHDYKITWGDMEELSENSCGIFIRSGGGNTRRELDGEVYVDTCNIVFNVHSNRSATGVLEGNDYCCKLRRTLLDVINKIIGEKIQLWDDSKIWDDAKMWEESSGYGEIQYWNDSNVWDDSKIWQEVIGGGEILHLIYLSPMGNVNPLGKNIQGIPVFSINFKLYYYYKEE